MRCGVRKGHDCKIGKTKSLHILLKVDDIISGDCRVLRLALDVDDLVLGHLEAGQDGEPDGYAHPDLAL